MIDGIGRPRAESAVQEHRIGFSRTPFLNNMEAYMYDKDTGNYPVEAVDREPKYAHGKLLLGSAGNLPEFPPRHYLLGLSGPASFS